ncbi:leucine-rich repeat-containing protein 52 [Tachyglossus aculeatus]|uniref:leucine-rich repeat-containing protein 52 n=1 Tax=Tachyglossus aculeatus TaxID=9261 RepID=UPI0018F6F794|nr:leucine-rich repeat-containing protein 52 [Tachyglossus aculeatus]
MRWWPLLLLALGPVATGSPNCPAGCSCQALEANCSGLGLEAYPRGLPLSTRRLLLASNRLTFLPAVELGHLSDLVHLDCGHNLLSEVADFTFAGVGRLVHLDLSFNNLSSLSAESFSSLGALMVLNLSHNPRLAAVPRDAFANATSLRQLDLSSTGLTFLDALTISQIPSLRSLHLGGNPWICRCNLLGLTIHLLVTHINYPDEQNATCRSPEELEGWPLSRVGNPLRYMCLTHLDRLDYAFLLLIGFCIFSAGTAVAWLTGACAVLYESVTRKTDDDDDDGGDDPRPPQLLPGPGRDSPLDVV